MYSTLNTTTEVRPLSKAPNPQLFPGHQRSMAAHCSGYVFTVCVQLEGLNAEHKFWVWVTILGHTSLSLEANWYRNYFNFHNFQDCLQLIAKKLQVTHWNKHIFRRKTETEFSCKTCSNNLTTLKNIYIFFLQYMSQYRRNYIPLYCCFKERRIDTYNKKGHINFFSWSILPS